MVTPTNDNNSFRLDEQKPTRLNERTEEEKTQDGNTGHITATGCYVEVELFGRDQRVRDGVNRQRDPVLHSYFAHQFGHMGLHCALFDAQC